jgi:hypothetical protein
MTGDDSTSTLTNADMDYLQQYLDNGGTLILTGQNINEDIGTSSFFSNYLYCAPNSNTVNTVTIAGAPGNPLTGAMNLLIIGTYGAYNQTSPSSVIPQGIAQSSFIYPNGQIAGINYYNANSGAHLVYLAFGLEAVSGLGGTTSRAQFLSAVFNWAGIPAEVNPPDFIAPLPNLFSIESIYPNPFNNTTTIKFSLQNDSEITINIFDLTGREVTVLGEGKFDSGSHLITWNAENLASGIYFINFQGNNINLTRKLLLLK